MCLTHTGLLLAGRKVVIIGDCIIEVDPERSPPASEGDFFEERPQQQPAPGPLIPYTQTYTHISDFCQKHGSPQRVREGPDERLVM